MKEMSDRIKTKMNIRHTILNDEEAMILHLRVNPIIVSNRFLTFTSRTLVIEALVIINQVWNEVKHEYTI